MQSVGGGCIHRCYRVRIDGAHHFLKLNDASQAENLSAEADGLESLAGTGATVPKVLAHGLVGDESYLLLEWLDLQRDGDFAALGRMLSRVHRTSGAAYGWHRGNFIGRTPQRNEWAADWKDFFWTRRLRPQLDLAASRGFALDVGDAMHLLDGHSPVPALVHGDLWGGNAGFAGGRSVLFDPAVYLGDREVDLAMTELFGGFPDSFYDAYWNDFPPSSGYEGRKHLYNLYHLLNHLNLFGAGYLAQVRETLRLLARGL